MAADQHDAHDSGCDIHGSRERQTLLQAIDRGRDSVGGKRTLGTFTLRRMVEDRTPSQTQNAEIIVGNFANSEIEHRSRKGLGRACALFIAWSSRSGHGDDQTAGPRGWGMSTMAKDEPHAKRRGWLKNGNPAGDPSTAPRCGAKTRKGISLHGTCHAKWSMPYARRHQYWATHLDRHCQVDASKLETRQILSGSQPSGEIAAPVASRVSRTVPEHYGIVPMKSA